MDADISEHRIRAREAIRKRVEVMAHNLPERLGSSHPFVVDTITDFVMDELESCMSRIFLACTEHGGKA